MHFSSKKCNVYIINQWFFDALYFFYENKNFTLPMTRPNGYELSAMVSVSAWMFSLVLVSVWWYWWNTRHDILGDIVYWKLITDNRFTYIYSYFQICYYWQILIFLLTIDGYWYSLFIGEHLQIMIANEILVYINIH